MFLKKKTPLNRALKEFLKRKKEEKCQIDIFVKTEVISQVFKSHIFANSYEFSNDFDIAIIINEKPSESLIHEWELYCLETDNNKSIVFCNKSKNNLEHLILVLIKENLKNNRGENVEMDIHMNCY